MKSQMCQHGSKYFACRPPSPPDAGGGVKWSKFIFFRTWSCCILKKGNHECNNMVANILPTDLQTPHPILGMRSKGQNSTFSQHGHDTYQIK